jgi:hypothetical protein
VILDQIEVPFPEVANHLDMQVRYEDLRFVDARYGWMTEVIEALTFPQVKHRTGMIILTVFPKPDLLMTWNFQDLEPERKSRVGVLCVMLSLMPATFPRRGVFKLSRPRPILAVESKMQSANFL